MAATRSLPGSVFEHTEKPLEDRFKPNGQIDLATLIALPTLFLQETSGVPNQAGRVDRLTRARMNGFNVVLEYVYEPGVPPILNSALRDFAVELGIIDFEF